MFSTSLDSPRPNDRGEFRVADGISSTVFRAILVAVVVVVAVFLVVVVAVVAVVVFVIVVAVVVVVVVVYLKRLRIVLRCAKAGYGRRTNSS